MVATLISSAEVAAPTRMTVEEYAQLGGDVPTELIDGRVVERGYRHARQGQLMADLGSILHEWARGRVAGEVLMSCGFVVRRHPDTVLGPALSFIEAARLSGQQPDGFIEGAPTLAVELPSPNDRWSEVEDEARLYFASGSRAVWVVDEPTQTVMVRTADGTTRVYRRDDTLPGGDVLPGFELPLSELFE